MKKKNVKNQITKLGPAISGTVRSVRLKCGKANCRCQSGKDTDKHGPYYFWARKAKGKLTSTSIPKEKVRFFKKWIQNRHKLEKLTARLLAQGEKTAKNSLKDK